MTNVERVKRMIFNCQYLEEADDVITDNLNLETIPEKIAFLIGAFEVQSVGNAKKDEATYFAMLSAIIEVY